MPNIHHRKFQNLLYQLFIFEKKYSVEVVCGRMNMNPRTMYDYLEGIRYFPPDLIGPLFAATGDMRIWTLLMDGTGLEAVPVDRAHDTDTVFDDLLDCGIGFGRLSELVKEVHSDGIITERESESISNRVSELIRELEGIRAKTKADNDG